jgi:2-polyprenyl-3-methyl-5-hydroxy-6-metoxy-1,4-benzoquinol methylase
MSQEAIEKAHKIYTGLPDWFYEIIVYRINTPFGWGARLADIDAFYKKHMSSNHLEIGLASSRFILNNAQSQQQVTLLDINPFNLKKSTEQLKEHYQIHAIEANILHPIETDKRYDSIALNYVLHCLPGDLSVNSKGICLKHLAHLLNKNGKLFGSTIIGQEVQHNAFGRFLMKKFNAKGIFNNHNDHIEDLRMTLESIFNQVEINQKGRLAFFVAS